MMEALNNVMNFKQSQSSSNTEYFKTFQAKVETADMLHSGVGKQPGRIKIELAGIVADPDMPMAEECEQARTTEKDKFLARLLLLNADKKCYSKLLRDIENYHTRNIGNYPDTPTAAFDLLVNYKPARSHCIVDSGLSFYTDKHEEEVSTQPPHRRSPSGGSHPPRP
jgi:hypothetical protein